MTDPPPDPATDTSRRPDPGPIIGTPRWVKVFGIVAVVVAMLIVVMLLTGHGPGRHLHGGLGVQGAFACDTLDCVPQS